MGMVIAPQNHSGQSQIRACEMVSGTNFDKIRFLKGGVEDDSVNGHFLLLSSLIKIRLRDDSSPAFLSLSLSSRCVAGKVCLL
jgi:hypothetical protein